MVQTVIGGQGTLHEPEKRLDVRIRKGEVVGGRYLSQPPRGRKLHHAVLLSAPARLPREPAPAPYRLRVGSKSGAERYHSPTTRHHKDPLRASQSQPHPAAKKREGTMLTLS